MCIRDRLTETLLQLPTYYITQIEWYVATNPDVPWAQRLKRALYLMRQKKGLGESKYPEPYRVEFHYTGAVESYTVYARSFKEALVRAATLKKKPGKPRRIRVEKLKEG